MSALHHHRFCFQLRMVLSEVPSQGDFRIAILSRSHHTVGRNRNLRDGKEEITKKEACKPLFCDPLGISIWWALLIGFIRFLASKCDTTFGGWYRIFISRPIFR